MVAGSGVILKEVNAQVLSACASTLFLALGIKIDTEWLCFPQKLAVSASFFINIRIPISGLFFLRLLALLDDY